MNRILSRCLEILDDSGVTPAHFAAQKGHLDCLQVNVFKVCFLELVSGLNTRGLGL